MHRLVGLILFSAVILVQPVAVRGNEGAPTAPGEGTELVYDDCYEHVGAFRVPTATIASLVGSQLPPGFNIQTFDDGTRGQLNVVGLDCNQGGHRVTDLLVNVPVIAPAGHPTLLRVRTYTDSAATHARYGLFCFGHVAALGDVVASVETAATGARTGHVFADDGASSIEMTTAVPPARSTIGAATLRHFTIKDGAVHGIIEWGSQHPGRRQFTVMNPLSGTLEVDGATPPGTVAFGAQHVYANEGQPHSFFHRGLSTCPPGLDWID